ncbi:MAG: chromate efflux transporter [Actinobacteria bacterium]|nr:chromate efflux transporter [Actinomycetota bacterium]
MEAPHDVSFLEAARFWVKLGFVNFGGPAGQIALMHDELVVRRRWVGERRFLHALSYCTLLPGPEAQQLAIYIGWLLHRTWGGILAGLAFILPAFFLMLVLAWTYAARGDVVWVGAVFGGLAAAVVGIVVVALLRLGGRALRGPAITAIAVAAFLAIHVVGVAFPFVVAGAALAGVIMHAKPAAHSAAADDDDAAIGDEVVAAPHTRATWGRSIRVLAIGLAVWWLPLLAVVAWRGGSDTLTAEAFFFSRAAVVTFGGAYAVLAYIKQAAVVQYGWLSAGDVAAGLGLAESTPGPLIMVTEFIGFVAAYRFPGDLAPLQAGLLGALVTVWATFAPCFLWIFLGAPFVERLRGNRTLGSALAGVTASVVGVIASLALSFGVGVLFDRATSTQPLFTPIVLPVWASVDGFAVAVALAAALAIQRFRVNVVWVVLAAGALGWLRSLVR